MTRDMRGMRRAIAGLFALGATALCGATARPALAAVDVALVLAIDVSVSVDDARFRLQREGIAAALESAAFASAIASGDNHAIEIAVLEWAEDQAVIVPWSVVRDRADLAELAARLRAAPRSSVRIMTDPGAAIAAADALFAAAPAPAERRVIDVSGDGAQNTGALPAARARDAAIAHGVTVNGLPIVSGSEPHIDDWYRANVVGGPEAFMIPAADFAAFDQAIRSKLVREVAAIAGGSRVASSQSHDARN